jgi:hypothetical protein
MSFYIRSTKLTFCSLKTFGFVLFLADKTLVTLSSKEKSHWVLELALRHQGWVLTLHF